MLAGVGRVVAMSSVVTMSSVVGGGRRWPPEVVFAADEVFVWACCRIGDQGSARTTKGSPLWLECKSISNLVGCSDTVSDAVRVERVCTWIAVVDLRAWPER